MSSEETAQLTRQEIEQRILATQEELDDVGTERALTLGGTGVHIAAKEAERMRNEFERDEARLEKKLSELRAMLD
jgi:hypothetical protein